jgi:hypothetical protein
VVNGRSYCALARNSCPGARQQPLLSTAENVLPQGIQARVARESEDRAAFHRGIGRLRENHVSSMLSRVPASGDTTYGSNADTVSCEATDMHVRCWWTASTRRAAFTRLGRCIWSASCPCLAVVGRSWMTQAAVDITFIRMQRSWWTMRLGAKQEIWLV